ncbi:uncharacterized protein C8A04DRAFT_11901 [Dichotomopilus funicola]|uniref:Rhodopsin domain-containing protein n=1 Tax=Dichotomopilus funicola TaxID=1934379 RepID=A0AAN6ZNB2_9PEZI|nr:hypothetical protein C8A04DRAFT_11901 [Dichotomopilus funicola]
MSTTQPPPPSPADLPHDSLKVNIIVSTTICWFIAAFFVALRVYTRGFILRVFGPSDWSILLALLFAAATGGAVIEQATHGAGNHIWDLDPNDTASALAWGRAAWYGILFYQISLCFAKFAILILYIHLFTFKWARRAGQILFGIVAVSHLYMTLLAFTACIPLYAYWDTTVTDKYCHPQALWWSATGLHMVTDFLIFILPMPVVWTIRLPRRQKYILSAIFGFGFIVCFISILRLIQLIRAQTDPDFTYVAAELSYLTAVELNGAIVCACVMTLKPLLARLFPRTWGSSSISSSAAAAAAAARAGARPRSTETLVNLSKGSGPGGPPTIGSVPSKQKLGPLGAMERDVWIESGDGGGNRGRGGGGGPRRIWVDGGYVELEDGDGDAWGVDVELVERVPGKRSHGRTRDVGDEEVGITRPEPPLGSREVRVHTDFRMEISEPKIGSAY